VPVYNPGAFLAPLLASLLAQTEPSFEIIAVDDGSTDGSAEVLRDAAARDPRLVVVTQPNGGYSAARNRGLDEARGRWLAFADSDDWLDPRALQTWREHGEREGLDVVFGNGFRFVGEATQPVVPTSDLVVTHRPPEGVFSGADWVVHGVAHAEWRHFVWLQLFRRSALVENGLRFDESIVHEDVLWCLHLGLRMKRIGYLDAPLYGYRIHGSSFSHSRDVELLHKRAASYLVIMKQLMNAADDPARPRALRRALLRHAQREGRVFHKLMRKGTLRPEMRRALASEFLRQGVGRAMFGGAENVPTFWRAIRCWLRMRLVAAS
jgi:glycosyltransferase involved in cell wall biosynthesis